MCVCVCKVKVCHNLGLWNQSFVQNSNLFRRIHFLNDNHNTIYASKITDYFSSYFGLCPTIPFYLLAIISSRFKKEISVPFIKKNNDIIMYKIFLVSRHYADFR